jgi:hypothetical protein
MTDDSRRQGLSWRLVGAFSRRLSNRATRTPFHTHRFPVTADILEGTFTRDPDRPFLDVVR